MVPRMSGGSCPHGGAGLRSQRLEPRPPLLVRIRCVLVAGTSVTPAQRGCPGEKPGHPGQPDRLAQFQEALGASTRTQGTAEGREGGRQHEGVVQDASNRPRTRRMGERHTIARGAG